MISFSIIFEDAGTATGERCIQCREIIIGTKFQLILEVGKTINGNITAFDGFLCEKCKIETDTIKGAKI